MKTRGFGLLSWKDEKEKEEDTLRKEKGTRRILAGITGTRTQMGPLCMGLSRNIEKKVYFRTFCTYMLHALKFKYELFICNLSHFCNCRASLHAFWQWGLRIILSIHDFLTEPVCRGQVARTRHHDSIPCTWLSRSAHVLVIKRSDKKFLRVAACAKGDGP